MARFAVEILIKSTGGPQAKAAMEGIGVGARAASGPVDQLAKQFLGVELNIKGIGRLAAQALGGLSIVSIGRQILQETKDAQAAMAQLEAGVKSTGGAAGLSAQQLDEMAGSLSRLTGIDDEVIAGGEAILLTFTKVGKTVFPEATKAALDMSVRMKTDLNSAVLQVGKALNDPIRGVTALRRVGVQLTEQQEAQIKTFVKSGNVMAAQKLILQELQTEFGGSAAAARNTMGGALEALKTTWGNLLEEVGGGGETFRQIIESMIRALQSPEFIAAAQRIGAAIAEAVKVAGSAIGFLINNLGALKVLAVVVAGVMGGPLAAAAALLAAAYFDYVGGINAAHSAELARLGVASDVRTMLGVLTDKTHELTAAEWLRVDAIKATMEAELARARAAINAETRSYKGQSTGALAVEEMLRGGWSKVGVDVDASIDKRAQKLEDLRGVARETEQQLKLLNDALAGHVRPAAAATAEDVELSKAQQRLTEQAAKAVEAAQLELRNAQSLLQARGLSTDAMKLEATVQEALSKARAAGAGATAKERVEIIQLTLAAAAAKAGIERIGEAESEVKRLFAESNKEMLKQLEILTGLDKVSADFLNVLSAENARQVEAGGAEASAVTRERLDYARQWRESWATASEVAEAEIAKIRGSLLTVLEQERAIAQVRSELLQESLSHWQNFFSTIEGLFGGATGKIAGQISNMIGNIQRAAQAGQSLSSGLGSMGMSGSAASAIGGAAGGVMIFAAVLKGIYDIRKAQIEAARLRQYSYGAAVHMGGNAIGAPGLGVWNPSALTGQAREASLAIQKAVEALADVMGGVLQTFARLEIKVRADGKYFQAFVEGELIGKFDSFAEAQEAAILGAFRSVSTTLSGASALVMQGLEQFRRINTAGGSSDELMEWFAALREISELSWSDGARQLREQTRHFDDLWASLERLRQATPEVVQGFTDLIAAEVNAWTSWRRSITGERDNPKERLAQLQQEGVLFNAMKAMRIAELKLRLVELDIDRNLLQARGTIVRGEGALGQAEIDIGRGYLGARAKLVKAEGSLYQAQLDAMAAAMEAINQLIEALLNIPDIKIPEIKLPRTGGGGAAGGGLRDMIRESEWQTSLANMSDFRRGLAETNKKWDEAIQGAGLHANALERARRKRDEAIKAANGNAEAIKKANEAFAQASRRIGRTREEIEAANRAREAEIALLQREARARAEELAGVGTDFTRSLQEGMGFFADLRDLGRQETGIPNWLLEILEGKFLARMGQEWQQQLNQFTGLSDLFLDIALQADVLRQNMLALAEAAGWSGQQIADAERAIADAQAIREQQAVVGLFQNLFGYLKDQPKWAEKAAEWKKKEVDLQFIIFRAQIEAARVWLEAAGLYDEALAVWGAARDAALAGLEAAQALAMSARDYAAAVAQDKAMVAGAHGDMAAAAKKAAEKFRDIVSNLVEANRKLLSGPLSSLSPSQQFATALADYQNTLGLAQGGNVKALQDIVGSRETLLQIAQKYFAGGGGDGLLTGYDELLRQTMQDFATLALSGDVETRTVQNLINEEIATIQGAADQNHQDLALLRQTMLDLMGGAPPFGTFAAASAAQSSRGAEPMWNVAGGPMRFAQPSNTGGSSSSNEDLAREIRELRAVVESLVDPTKKTATASQQAAAHLGKVAESASEGVRASKRGRTRAA